MNIKVQIKNQYGQDRILPICDKAKAFSTIAGTKTLTPEAIDQIKKLGYQVQVCSPAFL